jgi:hypothetical protein
MATANRSVITGGLRGKSGSVVFVQLPDGSVQVRERAEPRNPRTPVQTAWRRALSTASGAFRNLSETEYWQWDAYAKRESRNSSYNAASAFASLSARLFRYHGFDYTVPLTPPEKTFQGDTISVTAQASAGTIVFESSGPNRSGVVSEVGLFKLKSRFQNVRDRDIRHQGFTTFVATFEVEVVPGRYLTAVRFMDVVTGQVTDWIQLERVVV